MDKNEYIKGKIMGNVRLAEESPELLGESLSKGRGARGAIIGYLNACSNGDLGRRWVLWYLFGKNTTRVLSDAEWYALHQWVDAYQDPEEGWKASETFCSECFHLASYLLAQQKEESEL